MRKYTQFINKIHFIIGKKNTFDLYKISLFVLFATILEVLGITLIIPALNFLLNPNDMISMVEQKLSLDFFEGFLLVLKKSSMLEIGTFIVSLIFILFTFKFFYLLFVSWVSAKFVLDIQKYVTEKLFSLYLYEDYKFYLKSNGSILSSTVLKESSVFAGTIMSSVIVLLTEVSMMVGFILFILIFNPYLSIIIICISSIIVVIYYSLIKKKVRTWGKKRQDHDALKLKNLYQSFENIKIIKLMGLENFFKKNFFYHNRIAADMDRNTFFLSKVPNIGLEYLVIIILLVSLAAIFLNSTNINELITQLAVYAAVAFKMMPSINRSLNSITGLKYGAPVINLIFDELDKKRVNTFKLKNNRNNLNEEIRFEDEIKLENLNFNYEGTEKPILENISITISKNDFIGIIGESGSGKTTFLNIFLTLLQSSSGKYFVDQKEIKEENFNSWRKRISFVPQEAYLVDDTLQKNIAFGVEENLIDTKKVKKCLETAQFNIKDKNLDTIIGERGVQLSGGQKQRILIARALYNDPDIIVMDEPTSSLDFDTEKKIIHSINELSKNKTILLVSHRKSILGKCNKIFEIKNKKMNLVNENN